MLAQPHFGVQPDGTVKLEFGLADTIVRDNVTEIAGSISVAERHGAPRYAARLLRGSPARSTPTLPFAAHDSSAFVIRFQGGRDLFGGRFDRSCTAPWAAPEGSTATRRRSRATVSSSRMTSFPEYRADTVTMRDGAEIWEVLDDGTQRLFAVLRDEEGFRRGTHDRHPHPRCSSMNIAVSDIASVPAGRTTPASRSRSADARAVSEALEFSADPSDPWVMLPRSVFDALYKQIVCGRWARAPVDVGSVVQQRTEPRIDQHLLRRGLSPRSRRCGLLGGDQYSGWSAVVPAEEIEDIRVEITRQDLRED